MCGVSLGKIFGGLNARKSISGVSARKTFGGVGRTLSEVSVSKNIGWCEFKQDIR